MPRYPNRQQGTVSKAVKCGFESHPGHSKVLTRHATGQGDDCAVAGGLPADKLPLMVGEGVGVGEDEDGVADGDADDGDGLLGDELAGDGLLGDGLAGDDAGVLGRGDDAGVLGRGDDGAVPPRAGPTRLGPVT